MEVFPCVNEIENGQHKAKMDLSKALSTIFFVSWFLWISSDQFVVESKSFPLCGRTEINNGRWINSSAPYHVSWEPEEFEKYFIYGGPGFAVNFTQVWLPYDCSYHRWRNDTLQACAKHTAMKKNESSPLKIAFIGDSGTRGVFNGLTRLLSGSELYGPCSNVVCGNPGLPLSYRNLHQIFHVPFPPHVDLIFMYYKSLLSKGSVAAFKAVIDEKPHAIIFNTGAWDFDHLSRSMKGRVAPHGCDNEAFEAIASARASPEVREALKEITKYANKHQVRLLYRTNHFNRRFGAHCADDKFLAMLQEDEFRNSWDIWDNFNVSRDSWLEQTYDGFHFDRNKVHEVAHAKGYIEFCVTRGWEKPGGLETTLVQTLLHQLFYSCAQHFHHIHLKATTTGHKKFKG